MTSFRFGSHLPVLMKLVQMTEGPILEIGSGMNSTVFLYWACFHKQRRLVSYENNKQFFRRFRKLRKHWFDVRFVKDLDDADLSGDWCIAFIDHSPGKRRAVDIARVTDAEYVVIHDSESPNVYDYEKIYPLFKYRYDYRPGMGATPHTTVLSNKHDLTGLMEK